MRCGSWTGGIKAFWRLCPTCWLAGGFRPTGFKDRKENGDCYSTKRYVGAYYPNKGESYKNERKTQLKLQCLGIWGFGDSGAWGLEFKDQSFLFEFRVWKIGLG